MSLYDYENAFLRSHGNRLMTNRLMTNDSIVLHYDRRKTLPEILYLSWDMKQGIGIIRNFRKSQLVKVFRNCMVKADTGLHQAAL